MSRPKAEPAASPQHLMTIDEAAAYLNVPHRWVAEAVRTQRIRCTRIGKHVRFRPEHLEELISAGEQSVSAPPSGSVVPLHRRTGGRSLL